ncbi:MAG: PilC/PilY family type IV pilus protein [Candidatus Binatia bacterium]
MKRTCLGITVAVVAFVASLVGSRAARALDTDIFTGTQVSPNVLILFDNSGSMGNVPYAPFPDQVYSGSFEPSVVYTRCAASGGVNGAAVNADCTCKKTVNNYVADGSACAGTFIDLVPASHDDIDDREGRRKKGNRLNWETNQPRYCTQAPFDPCASQADCPGQGNGCQPQNQMGLAKSAMISTINDPDNRGVRWGLLLFDPPGINYNATNYSSSSWVTSWQVNSNVYQVPISDLTTGNEKANLISSIGGLQAEGGTPTAIRIIDGWKYYNGEVSKSGWGSPVQYTCQRNYMIMVTDGVPEMEADVLSSPQSSCDFSRVKSFVGNPGDLNGDGKEDPSSPNWVATTGESFNCGSDYMDDAVIKMRSLFPNGNPQNQPVKLYAVSFGINYCEPPAEGDTSPGGGMLLWRASKKYGGGECISAITPNELDDALREILNLIRNDAQSFVAPVVPVSQTNRTQSGDRLYVALFAPREGAQGWPGNIKKYALNTQDGVICNASTPSCSSGNGSATTSDGSILANAESYWDATTGGPSGVTVTSGGVGAVLLQRDLSTRKIYTYLGSSTGNLGGLDLTANTYAFAKSNTAITNATLGLSGSLGQPADRDRLIDYIYGFDSYDADSDGNTTEKRTWVMGDVIHSVPLLASYASQSQPDLIIVGANDGMLHAFDDATGQELWAFVPPDALANLHQLVPGEATQHPFFADGSPHLRTLDDGRKIVVFGLGRGGRAYYALDITSRTAPKLLWRINNTTSGFSELGYSSSAPELKRAAVGGNSQEVAVFGGGYDPAFDTATQTTANGGAGAMGRAVFMVDLLTGAKLPFSIPGGMTYPVAGDVLLFDVNGDNVFDRGYVGDLGGNVWRLNFDGTASKLFSAPAGHRIFYKPDAVVNSGYVTVYFGTGDRSNPMTTDTVDRFYAVRDDGSGNLTENDLVNVTNQIFPVDSEEYQGLVEEITDKQGWYITLGGTGEKMLAAPSVYFNVIFTTFTPNTAKCEAGGGAKIYVIDPITGAPTTDLAGTSGSGLGGGTSTGGGIGSGANGMLIGADRFVAVGNSIPTEIKVTFGDDTTKAFFGLTRGGGIALQPLNLPQIGTNVIPISWRQTW